MGLYKLAKKTYSDVRMDNKYSIAEFFVGVSVLEEEEDDDDAKIHNDMTAAYVVAAWGN